jgi:hypothetical protein
MAMFPLIDLPEQRLELLDELIYVALAPLMEWPSPQHPVTQQ